jgi:hypothetical protein
MVTIGIQNLPEPMERVETVYRDSNARLAPDSRHRPARRLEHFASSVQFTLNEPEAMRRRHGMTRDLRTVPHVGALLRQVVDGVLPLMRADFGNIQILIPRVSGKPTCRSPSSCG